MTLEQVLHYKACAPLLSDGGHEAVDDLVTEIVRLREIVDKVSGIAIEWIDLGIPDDDAINARGEVNDLRAANGLAIVETPD